MIGSITSSNSPGERECLGIDEVCPSICTRASRPSCSAMATQNGTLYCADFHGRGRSLVVEAKRPGECVDLDRLDLARSNAEFGLQRQDGVDRRMRPATAAIGLEIDAVDRPVSTKAVQEPVAIEDRLVVEQIDRAGEACRRRVRRRQRRCRRPRDAFLDVIAHDLRVGDGGEVRRRRARNGNRLLDGGAIKAAKPRRRRRRSIVLPKGPIPWS